MKQNLARTKMALPNSYCGLPLQKSCPHANACLTCPLFVTTAEFLPQHRKQLDDTRTLIARAETDGHTRVVEMNRTVEDDLLTIVTTLERGHHCSCAAPPSAKHVAGRSSDAQTTAATSLPPPSSAAPTPSTAPGEPYMSWRNRATVHYDRHRHACRCLPRLAIRPGRVTRADPSTDHSTRRGSSATTQPTRIRGLATATPHPRPRSIRELDNDNRRLRD